MAEHDHTFGFCPEHDETAPQIRIENAREFVVGVECQVPLVDGRQVRYTNFDNAATTPPFTLVLDCSRRFFEWYASVHRGSGFKSQLSTHVYEKCREIVAGFVGADLALQRDQFLRINNARPLPRSLVTELLPEVDTFLPRRLAARKLPSAITDLLNRHPESPFRDLIKRPSSTPEERRKAVVTDTSVIDMVKARLVESSGCLFPYRNVATGETDSETVVDLLVAYWRAVRRSFPEAWGLPPTKSRLMHGAGIKAMGTLMDAIVPRQDPSASDLEDLLAEEIGRIVPLCRWTAGTWEALGGLPWNGIENTSRSVRVLSNHLVREYTLSRHRR